MSMRLELPRLLRHLTGYYVADLLMYDSNSIQAAEKHTTRGRIKTVSQRHRCHFQYTCSTIAAYQLRDSSDNAYDMAEPLNVSMACVLTSSCRYDGSSAKATEMTFDIHNIGPVLTTRSQRCTRQHQSLNLVILTDEPPRHLVR